MKTCLACSEKDEGRTENQSSPVCEVARNGPRGGSCGVLRNEDCPVPKPGEEMTLVMHAIAPAGNTPVTQLAHAMGSRRVVLRGMWEEESPRERYCSLQAETRRGVLPPHARHMLLLQRKWRSASQNIPTMFHEVLDWSSPRFLQSTRTQRIVHEGIDVDENTVAVSIYVSALPLNRQRTSLTH